MIRPSFLLTGGELTHQVSLSDYAALVRKHSEVLDYFLVPAPECTWGRTDTAKQIRNICDQFIEEGLPPTPVFLPGHTNEDLASLARMGVEQIAVDVRGMSPGPRKVWIGHMLTLARVHRVQLIGVGLNLQNVMTDCKRWPAVETTCWWQDAQQHKVYVPRRHPLGGAPVRDFVGMPRVCGLREAGALNSWWLTPGADRDDVEAWLMECGTSIEECADNPGMCAASNAQFLLNSSAVMSRKIYLSSPQQLFDKFVVHSCAPFFGCRPDQLKGLLSVIEEINREL